MTASPNPHAAVSSLDEARLTKLLAERAPVDIYAAWDADRKARDWGRLHVEADRRRGGAASLVARVLRIKAEVDYGVL